MARSMGRNSKAADAQNKRLRHRVRASANLGDNHGNRAAVARPKRARHAPREGGKVKETPAVLLLDIKSPEDGYIRLASAVLWQAIDEAQSAAPSAADAYLWLIQDGKHWAAALNMDDAYDYVMRKFAERSRKSNQRLSLG